MVLEIFFAGNIKENSKSLKPVYVPDTNKAWINKYRGSFLLKLLRTIHLMLVTIDGADQHLNVLGEKGHHTQMC